MAATFPFCPQKLSTTIAPGSEALLAVDSFHVRTGTVQDRKQISACFLPAVQKLSVASMQHYGVMIARSGSTPPPQTNLEERIAALPEAARQELTAELATWNAALAKDPKDLAALIARAAALDRAGLLYDAGEAYSQGHRRVAGSGLGAEPGCRDRANPGARTDEKGVGAATVRSHRSAPASVSPPAPSNRDRYNSTTETNRTAAWLRSSFSTFSSYNRIHFHHGHGP